MRVLFSFVYAKNSVYDRVGQGTHAARCRFIACFVAFYTRNIMCMIGVGHAVLRRRVHFVLLVFATLCGTRT